MRAPHRAWLLFLTLTHNLCCWSMWGGRCALCLAHGVGVGKAQNRCSGDGLRCALHPAQAAYFHNDPHEKVTSALCAPPPFYR